MAAPAGGWTVDSLRALGAARWDPLRFAYVQALARRSADRQGAARQWLDARLAQALADCAARCDAARVAAGAAAPAVPARRPAPPGPSASPLASLVQRLDQRLPVTPASAVASAGELRALQPFRRQWSKASAEGQLARSVAQLPANPGPLNSALLALRAMQQMQALSPAYLQHFVAQVEALLWLDGAAPPAPAGGRQPTRSTVGKGASPSRKAGKGR